MRHSWFFCSSHRIWVLFQSSIRLRCYSELAFVQAQMVLKAVQSWSRVPPGLATKTRGWEPERFFFLRSTTIRSIRKRIGTGFEVENSGDDRWRMRSFYQGSWSSCSAAHRFFPFPESVSTTWYTYAMSPSESDIAYCGRIKKNSWEKYVRNIYLCSANGDWLAASLSIILTLFVLFSVWRIVPIIRSLTNVLSWGKSFSTLGWHLVKLPEPNYLSLEWSPNFSSWYPSCCRQSSVPLQI